MPLDETSANGAPNSDDARNDATESLLDRVLRSSEANRSRTTMFHDERRASALQSDDTISHSDTDGLQLDREARRSLQHVDGLSTELEDVTEVEYRQVRLEKVVLIGVYAAGTIEDAENSMHELAALCETAGAAVLDGILQRRPHPDASTYLGRGKVEELADIVRSVGADTVVADHPDLRLGRQRRRRDRQAIGVKAGMRHAANVPQLQHYAPAGGVHRVRDAAPTVHLRL